MASLNRAQILGRLGADPQVGEVGSGKFVCKLSVATSEKYKDKDGQSQENVSWHRIVAWNKLAEICGKYLTKGSTVFIEGRLQTRSFENKQGQKQYVTEIIASNVQFLTPKNHAEKEPDFSEPDFDSSEGLPF